MSAGATLIIRGGLMGLVLALLVGCGVWKFLQWIGLGPSADVFGVLSGIVTAVLGLFALIEEYVEFDEQQKGRK